MWELTHRGKVRHRHGGGSFRYSLGGGEESELIQKDLVPSMKVKAMVFSSHARM